MWETFEHRARPSSRAGPSAERPEDALEARALGTTCVPTPRSTRATRATRGDSSPRARPTNSRWGATAMAVGPSGSGGRVVMRRSPSPRFRGRAPCVMLRDPRGTIPAPCGSIRRTRGASRAPTTVPTRCAIATVDRSRARPRRSPAARAPHDAPGPFREDPPAWPFPTSTPWPTAPPPEVAAPRPTHRRPESPASREAPGARRAGLAADCAEAALRARGRRGRGVGGCGRRGAADRRNEGGDHSRERGGDRLSHRDPDPESDGARES